MKTKEEIIKLIDEYGIARYNLGGYAGSRYSLGGYAGDSNAWPDYTPAKKLQDEADEIYKALIESLDEYSAGRESDPIHTDYFGG